MKNLRLIFSVSLIIFCLISSIFVCANQIAITQDGKEVLLKPDGTWEYIEDQSQESYKTFKMGTTIKISNFQFCLNSVRWSKGNNLDSPKSDHIWLILDCTVKNISKEPTIISSMLMFKLRNKEGYSQKHAIFATPEGNLDSELSPNQVMRGEIAFEVETKQLYWEFIFEPDILGLGQVIYSIEKEQIK